MSPPDGSKFSVIGNFVVSKHYFHKHSFTISENVSYWLLRYFAPSLSKHVLLMLEALHKKVTSVSEAGTPKDTIPPLQRITFMQESIHKNVRLRTKAVHHFSTLLKPSAL